MSQAQEIIKCFNRYYGFSDRDVLFIQKLREAGLADEQIAAVISALDETCPVCRNAEQGCHCWNDE